MRTRPGSPGADRLDHPVPAGIFLRSILFNLLFYLTLLIYLIIALPTFLLPPRAIVGMAKFWGRSNLWLLRIVCGLDVAFSGVEKIPSGPLLVAAKHQSIWETFALLWLFDAPTFIVKRELMWVPLFGWFMWKGGMVAVDRDARRRALTAMTRRACEALRNRRQIVIFPEGTRVAPGAPPDYKSGIALLYAEGGVPCLPIAHNSGLFWGRRSFLRYPGTVRVEILDPIPPGLSKEQFLERLQHDIEAATTRLIAQAKA